MELTDQRWRRRKVSVATVVLAGILAIVPRQASAEGLFDLFFGGLRKQHQAPSAQASFFADPFQQNQQPTPPSRPVAAGGGPPFVCEAATASIFR